LATAPWKGYNCNSTAPDRLKSNAGGSSKPIGGGAVGFHPLPPWPRDASGPRRREQHFFLAFNTSRTFPPRRSFRGEDIARPVTPRHNQRIMADIRHSIQISASPEAVYALVATADGFAQWWAEDVDDNEGQVTLGFFNRATVYRLAPKVETPHSRMEWYCQTGKEWAGTALHFHLIPAGGGTLLRFTHADWEAETDDFVSYTTVWGELMFRLKSAAEGKPRGPLFLRSSLAY